ncbi:MAG: hypothetical protein JRJ71_05275 [Deltaproteobacteria bacterium]|nr:hypothetical protein [Deltaproteobacteria bacterium]
MKVNRDKGRPFGDLSLRDLTAKNSLVLRDCSGTRPAIWTVEEGGVRAVVKDFSRNAFLFRNTVGRFLIWREQRAYLKLKGIKGVPAFLGVVGGLALITEEVPGRSLENLEKEMKLPDSFFASMTSLVSRIHERGLAHCDLKRAPNTLLGDDGQPYIVDWAASISESEFKVPPLSLIYRRFKLDDRMAITKLKLRHCPDKVSPEEAARYNYRSWGERLIRGIRDRLRELLQRAV